MTENKRRCILKGGTGSEVLQGLVYVYPYKLIYTYDLYIIYHISYIIYHISYIINIYIYIYTYTKHIYTFIAPGEPDSPRKDPVQIERRLPLENIEAFGFECLLLLGEMRHGCLIPNHLHNVKMFAKIQGHVYCLLWCLQGSTKQARPLKKN